MKVLSGQGNGSLSLQNGEVVLNIGPLITQVKDTLIAQGVSVAAKIPVVNATFPLFAAPNLEKAQQGYRLITTLRWVLPIVTLLLFAVGIWVARSRRHGLLGSGLGLAASMLVLGIALTIARGVYLNSVPSSTLPSDAAGVLYDTLIRFVREALRALLVVGLIVAAGAFLTGPAAAAVSTRRDVRQGIGWLRGQGRGARGERRPGRRLDGRAQDGAARRVRRRRRPDLRLRGPADGGPGDLAGGAAAGGARGDRAARRPAAARRPRTESARHAAPDVAEAPGRRGQARKEEPVVVQAAGFALLAAISPTALLVMAVFLGSDNPRRIALLYVAGAVLMTVIMAVTVLLVLRTTGLNQPRQRTPRYGLRLGLGILALAIAAWLAARAARARHAPAAGRRARRASQGSSPGSPRGPGRSPPSWPACCCSCRRPCSSPPSRSSPPLTPPSRIPCSRR